MHNFRVQAALVGLTFATCALPGTSQVLSFDDGLLGQSVTYRLSGNPFAVFVLLPSFSSGPTPLALIDPLDPRLLSVGLDLLSVATFGALDGLGQAAVTYPLPNNLALSNLGLYAQAITVPGVGTLVDTLSNPTGFALGASQSVTNTLGSLPLQVGGGHSLTVLQDGRVLIAGGSVNDALGVEQPANRLQIFDPKTQSFSLLAATLSHPRTAHTATRLADGRVLLLGGTDDLGAARNTADIFDPVTGTVSAAAPMAVARVGHAAVLLNDGRVYVTGGITAINAADPLASINSITGNSQRYQPSNNTWSAAPNLPLPRAGHAVSRLADGRVLLSGGLEVASLFGIPLPAFSDDCRIYNPTTNALQDIPDFTGNRILHAQLTLSNGKVLVVGGADGNLLTQTFSPLGSTFLYDPATNGWTAGGSLSQPRAFHGLHELASGQVLTLGGLATVDVLTTTGSPALALEYAPLSAASWSTPGNLPSTRPGAQTANIDGGDRVLVIGAPTDGLGSLLVGDLSALTVLR
jgi:N-acetylneuraminic acid mutarotase